MTHLLHVVCDHTQQGVAKMAKMTRFVETDLQTRIYRVTSGINESITVAANEPSVGLFRLQEHVVGTVPKLVSERLTMDDIAQRVQGANFDIEYDTETVKGMAGITQFSNILTDLHRALELKQNLNRREHEHKFQSYQEQSFPSPAAMPNRARVDQVPVLPSSSGNTSLNTETHVYQVSKIQPRTF